MNFGITKTVPAKAGVEYLDSLYDGSRKQYEFHMAGREPKRLKVGDYVYTIFNDQLHGRLKIKKFVTGETNPDSGKPRILIIVGVIVLVFAGIGAAIAVGSDDDTEAPITGVELEKASEAAITHVGGGTVTDTEVEDEESYYEVEVTREDGSQVDVQLDENFNVVGVEEEDGEDDD